MIVIPLSNDPDSLKVMDLRWGPAHQRVLPPLSGVKVHLPLLGAVDARLHGCFGGDKDVNLAGFDVLLRDPRQSRDVLREKEEKKNNRRWRKASFRQETKSEGHF